MDSLRFKRTVHKIKIFLLSKKSREILIFLLFFLVAAGFWLAQTLNDTYETRIHIPLRLHNVPEGIIITESLPEHLEVEVRDKGTLLFSYLYGSPMRSVEVDFLHYQAQVRSGRIQIPLDDIYKQLQQILPTSSTIGNIRPDTLQLYYNLGGRKKLPVRLAGHIVTTPQTYLARVHCTPDSVWAYAPQSILDTLTAAYTRPVDKPEMHQSQVETLPLSRIRGVKFSEEQVQVHYNVDTYTEKTVEVPVEAVDFPASHSLRTFPATVKITFRVGVSRFRSVTASDFFLGIRYDELVGHPSAKYPLSLGTLPEGVSQVRIQPGEVEYLIEQISEE